MQLQPPLPALTEQPRKLERDERWFTLGVGPLLLANVHWLDQPKDRSVTVGKARGTDDRYPGFEGTDATIGLMLDFRFWHFFGIEVDLFRQNDRGTGKIVIRDAGNLCFVPGIATPYAAQRYQVTMGQSAWHVPLLLKLTVSARKVVEQDDDVAREVRKWFTTFAFGPELVFPGDPNLDVSKESGLDYPLRASASNYVMYTGALGFERRITTSQDIRLLLSLRGSYNPASGTSAMKRGEYALVESRVVPVTYSSEWRYQAALTLGVGWFF